MMKPILATALAVCLALPATAIAAQSVSGQGARTDTPSAAAASQQVWTHPKGCRYSRAGRPGEVVWFIITNTRRPGCPTYIVQKSIDDIYR